MLADQHLGAAADACGGSNQRDCQAAALCGLRGEGRGDGWELLVPCKVCGGSGLGQVSDCRRAAALGRDESGYRERWRGIYQWMLQRFSEAEQDAAYRFTMVLSTNAA